MNTDFRIRELRKAIGISQQELADRLGYKSGAAITMWEKGTRNPPSSILPKIASILGVSVGDLFVNTGQDSA